MYSITSVVYGIPVNSALSRYLLENYDDPEYEIDGFTELYHGGIAGRMCGFIGAELSTWDETEDLVRVSGLRMQPTDEERQKVDNMIAALPQGLRDVAADPDVYLVFSSS